MGQWSFHGIVLGAQYAMEGITISMQTPAIRHQKFLGIIPYLCFVTMILYGLTRVLMVIPTLLFRTVLVFFTQHANDIAKSISSTLNDMVLSLPFLALLFMRYVYPEPLDGLFIETLRHLDKQNPRRTPFAEALQRRRAYRNEMWSSVKAYLRRTWKKLQLGALLYLLSLIPTIGPAVFPLAGAYTICTTLGNTQGVVVGVCFWFFPRQLSMQLVRSLIGMRAIMRELLEPYFARTGMSSKYKRSWFSRRKDILFGFSAIAYLLTRIPILGFVGYGLSQAAVAYLLIKVDYLPKVKAMEETPKKEMTQKND